MIVASHQQFNIELNKQPCETAGVSSYKRHCNAASHISYTGQGHNTICMMQY
jgi:sugar/nucleoside kinase (ribokinase family)